jgi:hypothetical protein
MEEVDSALFYSSKAVSIIKNKKANHQDIFWIMLPPLKSSGNMKRHLLRQKKLIALQNEIRMLTPYVMLLF